MELIINMEHVIEVYSTINSSSNCVMPKNVGEIIKNKVKNNDIHLEDRWLLEIIKSFYNIGFENGKKNNN
jgi:hypothetical protein